MRADIARTHAIPSLADRRGAWLPPSVPLVAFLGLHLVLSPTVSTDLISTTDVLSVAAYVVVPFGLPCKARRLLEQERLPNSEPVGFPAQLTPLVKTLPHVQPTVKGAAAATEARERFAVPCRRRADA